MYFSSDRYARFIQVITAHQAQLSVDHKRKIEKIVKTNFEEQTL